MSTFSDFARQALAGFAALAITASLLVGSFAYSPQGAVATGLLA